MSLIESKTQSIDLPSTYASGDAPRQSRHTITLHKLWRFTWKLVIVAAVAAFVVYRVRFAPIVVASRPAAMGPIVAEVLGTGTLEARTRATISPKISGLLTAVLADQGDRITKGQRLATLDDGDLRQQVEIAKAEVAAVKAGVDRAAAEISRAEANAAQARQWFDRVSRLMKSQSATSDEFDKATQQRDVAEAELRRALFLKVELERQVAKAGETLRYYQERLGDTTISSPFDGLVVRRNREPGDIVVPGTEILQIISTHQMWVSAWVDETAMASLAVGQPARVVFRSERDRPYIGVVSRIAPLADRETREFLVDVTVKELPRLWAVGQRAEVYIETARKDQALLAPAAAIMWRNGQPGLYVSEMGRAKWRNVELGLRASDTVEVVTGLSAGDQTIWPASPASPISEGRAVKLVGTP